MHYCLHHVLMPPIKSPLNVQHNPKHVLCLPHHQHEAP